MQYDENVSDFKLVVVKLLKNWPLFVLSTFTCLALASAYCYFASSEWKISGKILIDEQKDSVSPSLRTDKVNSGLPSSANTKGSVINEIEVLRSRSLIAQVVRKLQLNVRTYRKLGLKYEEIYENEPFIVTINSIDDTLNQQEYLIQIKDSAHYQIKNNKEDLDQVAAFGDTFKLSKYKIIINKTAVFEQGIKGHYKVKIESPDETVAELLEDLSIQLSSKQATSLDLSLNYPNPKKGEVILNKIMTVYLHNNFVNKNSIADSTTRFINRRLAVVRSNLKQIEKQLQNYKQENKIADVTEQSKAIVSAAKSYYDRLNEIEVQLVVIADINSNLNKNNTNKLIPASLTANDTTVGKNVNSYNGLVFRREKLKASSGADSVSLQKIERQEDSVRKALIKNLASYQQSLIAAKNKLNKQNASFTGKIKQVPVKERVYLDYVQQQNLQQELALFLIQKREEIAISKTSANQGSHVIDAAKSDFLPFKPKKSIIYTFSLILGLVLPAIYLFIKELFNIRINTKADIEKITSIPIIGEINHIPGGKTLVVNKSFDTVVAQQFLKVCNNLQYLVSNQKSKVLLFTSSMSGEGKSFLSLNLGNALAITGKKVVFIELDLRKPKLSQNIGIDNSVGYTNYAINNSVSIESILKPLWFHENCFLISSGEIPPNPAELMESHRLENLVSELKKRFDYLIIDCSPVGIVSDALLIEKLTDIIIYVVRQEYTYKSQLGIVNDLKEAGKAKNIYLIVNGIQDGDKSKSDVGSTSITRN